MPPLHFRHLYPPEYESVGRAYATQLPGTHTFIPVGSGDLFDDYALLEEHIVAENTILYSPGIDVEQFGMWIAKTAPLLAQVDIAGIIAHGKKGFQPYALLGLLRFAREQGAKHVYAVLPKEHEDKKSYYEKSVGFKKHDISVKVVSPDTPPKQERKFNPEEEKTGNMEKIDHKPYYFWNRAGGAEELPVRGEAWEDWETHEPHSVINAHWAGFPTYINPSDILHVGNVIQWFKPSLIVEMNAWKFGMTAFMLQASEYDSSKIIAVNSPGLHQQDISWFERLKKERPGASERVRLVHLHAENPAEDFKGETGGDVFFMVNYHKRSQLAGCAKLFFASVPPGRKGVIMFHATGNQDCPAFLTDFKKSEGVREVRARFNPPNGSWFTGGIFAYHAKEKQDDGL